MKMIKIAILCTMKQAKTNYRHIPGLELYDRLKDCRTFSGNIPVIAHPPCAQWSRLKSFAKTDIEQKELAYFCFEQVNKNGGIFEHPSGSSFFKAVGADFNKIISIDQLRFGHPGRKRTWLYFQNCSPVRIPTQCKPKTNDITSLSKNQRLHTPLRFAKWLVNSIRWTFEQSITLSGDDIPVHTKAGQPIFDSNEVHML